MAEHCARACLLMCDECLKISDQWSLEDGRKGIRSGGCGECSGYLGSFRIYNALLPASVCLRFLFPRLPNEKDQSICLWLPLHLYPTMPFVDLDAV